MVDKNYKKFVREQKKLAQKQANKLYKEKSKKLDKKLEKITKSSGNAINKISESYGYKKTLSTNLLKTFVGSDNKVKQKTAGRPKLVFIHTSPFTNKPIPAPQYYKELRAFKRMQKLRAENMQEQQLKQYAQRGISPNQLKEIQERARQQQLLQQQRQQIPKQNNQNPINQLQNGTIIQTGNRIWHSNAVVGEEGGLFGRQKKIYGAESSFWN